MTTTHRNNAHNTTGTVNFDFYLTDNFPQITPG